jgi:benzoyl-CoA reductase subunit C
MNKEEIMRVFQDALDKPLNSHLEQWIAGGGKVVGHYCSLVPGEIFTAAGIAPYRVRGGGSEETTLADVYLSSHLCTFVRHTVNLTLEDRFDFLSGIVATNGCDQARRAYDVWEKKTEVPFRMILSIPRTPKEYNIGWFIEELQRLMAAMEDYFSVKTGPQDLLDAIRLHNRVRKNLGRLHDLRKRTNPPITGAEATAVTIAAHVMPLKEYNTLLEKLIRTLENHQGVGQYRVRLMVTGGEMDEPEFIKAIEAQGGLVVYEDTCFGARYYEEPVSEEGDPLTRIAERYFYRLPCARMEDSFPPRYENLLKMVDDLKAEGLIVQRLNHCLLNAGHSFLFNLKAKAGEIPTLFIEREYLGRGYGQISTRVQAFIERIESMKSGGRVPSEDPM